LFEKILVSNLNIYKFFIFFDLYSISNYIFIEASNRVYLNVLLRDQIDLLKYIFALEIAFVLDNKQVIFSYLLLISIVYSIIIRISFTIVVCIKFVIVINLYNFFNNCFNNCRDCRNYKDCCCLLCYYFCCLFNNYIFYIFVNLIYIFIKNLYICINYSNNINF